MRNGRMRLVLTIILQTTMAPAALHRQLPPRHPICHRPRAIRTRQMRIQLGLTPKSRTSQTMEWGRGARLTGAAMFTSGATRCGD
jgi:hypothetical protein